MTTAIIFLHGSGDTGPNLRLYMDSIPLEQFEFRTFTQVGTDCGMTVFTPSAKPRKYTPAFGSEMNVWFDRSANFNTLGLSDTYEDLQGTRESLDVILREVDKIQAHFDFIFVGGFSQGGGLCLHLLREALPSKVLGIFCLSSFLIETSAILKEGELRSTIPLMMMHGAEDSLIQCAWGEATGANLLMLGVEVQFRKYEDLDHELCPEELADLMSWMQDLISTNSTYAATNTPKYIKKSIETNKQLNEEVNANALPYSMEKVEGKEGSYTIRYACRPELVDVLTARQVLCRGSCFDITVCSDGRAVQTIVSSTDPEGTALEIGKRLLFRVNSGQDANFNPCPMS